MKILDFMWALAGPGATRILADWGATIIRLESSSKVCVGRTLHPFMDGDESQEKSAIFHTINAGRRMLTLNLTSPGSLEVARDLVRWADVVTESFSPRAMKAFGLDYDSLREINPDIIMLSTCLMGQTGPLSMFAGYGNLAAAIAGFYSITGWEDRDPAGPFQAAGIPAAMVQNSPELVVDPQLEHLGHLVQLPHQEGGHTVIESTRIHMSRSQAVVDTSAPTFNRDMMFALNDVLGYDDERIGELLVSGALE